MVEPDPWNVIDKNQENTQNCVANQSPNHESNANPSAFEDNFLTIDGSVSEKLPDSCEYIQALGKYILFLQKIYRNFFFLRSPIFCSHSYWKYTLPNHLFDSFDLHT